ncbi:7-carboxy-7-deazaguanine synthase QueE [Paenibacillus polymyxa]|uniref:7-carboxy-7-deazaguanine synthase QueE n=1 Tax=Paenibacillus TaxID=44249 RepID=UPI000F4D5ECF|nr:MULTISPECIES: 7-carboxy-7-deazaguanine synthase QueE [Paenibacillus]KAF6657962.1 7-carboxy-7-deazaguanine synthase QueE [Paenibacillus sp. EKM301P]RPE07360.1 7-carboxy-7-deazaguanine synthase QueE [Paenibacillus polymyxa]UBS88313.1 7-carboxy-7-deazaguanine synthase QueE [Paenibacillus polymyxa]WHX36906.1 7-carboxy-7-deazaguanine synthase QueE [Paenibacillus polymyxa]
MSNTVTANTVTTHQPMATPDRAKAAPIPVLEVFGPTVQGEGMVIGRKTMFVRTAGCDYHCSWCDSAFTWDGSAKDQIRRLSATDIWQELQSIGGERFSHVTLSGGNPALLPQLGTLITLLRSQGIATAVETQGSRWQEWLYDIDEVTLSPKPPSSGMTTNWDVLDDIVARLTNRKMAGASKSTTNVSVTMCTQESNNESVRLYAGACSLKVVIFDDTDLAYARTVHERYPHVPLFLQTGNPDVNTENTGQIAESLLHRYEWLIDRVMDDSRLNDVRVLPQLHTLVWGNKRGV